MQIIMTFMLATISDIMWFCQCVYGNPSPKISIQAILNMTLEITYNSFYWV